MTAEQALEDLAKALPPPIGISGKARLPELIDDVEVLGIEAGKLARAVGPHIPGAAPDMAAFLHRVALALRDLNLAVEHAVANLTPTVRANLADR
jgi:hypothetical protein